jgi:predicted ester cyclase
VERNKAIVRREVEELWNKCDYSKLEDFLAPETVFYYRGRKIPYDAEHAKMLVSRCRNALPDFKFTVWDMIGEGDRVAVRLTARANIKDITFTE